MKTKAGAAAVAAVVTMALSLAGTNSVAVAAEARAPAEGSDRYGSPAGDMPYDREVRLGSGGRGVNVARYETIKFVTSDGKEFRWRFDTFGQFEIFPLAHIAPAGVSVPASVNVHVTGDIPIAP
jgi:hypothetical protein